MASDNSLIFPASIDLGGLDSDIVAAESMVDAFAGSAASKLTGMPASKIKVDIEASKSTSASSVAATFLPMAAVGSMISSKISSAIAPIPALVSKVGATISKQLADSFNFDKAKDSFESMRHVVQHDVGIMKANLASFGTDAATKASAPFKAMKASIADADMQLKKLLLHGSASFQKGGFNTFDTFFQKQTKTYKAGDVPTPKASSASAGISAAISPKEIAKASGGFLKLGGILGFVATAGLAVTTSFGFIAHGIKGASDLAETVNRVNVTLGSGSPAVQKFADDMATNFGLVRNQTLSTAASFAGIGKSLGRITGNNLVGFSTGMTKLAADLSSFANIDLSTASQAIQTTLAGNQSDLLKSYGVIVTDTTIKQYAMANGIAKVGMELTEQQKFMARSALITQGLARASGDLERTQDGAANQGRKLMGSIENLATSIGGVLLPVVNSGMQILNEFVSMASAGFESNKATIEGWADSVLGAFDYVIAVVHNFPAAFEVARLKVVEILANIGNQFEVLGPNIATIAEHIANNWQDLLVDAFNATYQALLNLGNNFYAIADSIAKFLADPTQGFHVDWTPLLDGFEATAAKLPELLKPAVADMSKEIAEAARPITAEVSIRQAKRAAAKGAAAQLVDTPLAAEAIKPAKDTKKNEKQFAAALELGSTEAYSSVVSATSGRSKGMDELNRNSKNTADNTAEIAKILAPRGANKPQRPARLEFA